MQVQFSRPPVSDSLLSMKDGDLAELVTSSWSSLWNPGDLLWRKGGYVYRLADGSYTCDLTNPTLRVRVCTKGEKVTLTI